MKRKKWKLKKYMFPLMIGGVAVSKYEMYRKFSRFQYPDSIKKLGMTKVSRGIEKERVQELAKELHCSTSKVKKYYLPYLRNSLSE